MVVSALYTMIILEYLVKINNVGEKCHYLSNDDYF